MKNLFIKFSLLLILITFINYLIFAWVGLISCIFGADSLYFCGKYCCFVKIFASITYLGWLIFFIKKIINKRKEKQ